MKRFVVERMVVFEDKRK